MTKADQPARVVFLDRNTLPADVNLRSLAFPHELIVFDATAPDQVRKRIAEADIVITNKVPVRAAAIAAAHRLRMIAVAATGYDNIDLDACAARRITVSNIRNYAGEHGSRAHVRADPRAQTQRRRVSAVSSRRRVAAFGTVLLFRLSDPRPRGIDARRHRRRRARPGCRRPRQSVRHACPVFQLQGRCRHGAALYPFRGGAAAKRRHHPAYALDDGDSKHDRGTRVRAERRMWPGQAARRSRVLPIS